MSKQDVLQEMANRASAGELDLAGWMGSLPDPDPVLRKRGEYAEVLNDLTADDQVCMAMQQRKLKTLLKRDYQFSPGAAPGEEPTPEAQALCQALVKDLENVDLYNLIAEVLDAPFHGYTVAELYWRKGAAGDLRIQDIIVKPRRWFGYNHENRLVFPALLLPEPVPPHKFAVARHFPTYDNPYGLRLLSRVLWPVAFKKGGVRFWLNFCEKFGFPWLLGQAPSLDTKQREESANALARMVRDAVAVVSGLDVSVHEFGGKGGDLHQKLVQHWDNAISKVLVGQTLTSDVGDHGSYAASNTHYNVLDDITEADSVLVEAFINEVGWSYGQVNAGPGTYAPLWRYNEPEDQAAQAELDTKLHGLGVRFRKEHFTDKYGLPGDRFDLAGADTGAAPEDPGTGAAFASPEGGGQDGQELADGLADQALDQVARTMRGQADTLLDLVERAESYEDALLLLAESLALEDDDALVQDMLAAMVNADLLGRWAARKETE